MLVTFSAEGPVAIIRLNRPDQRNAVNMALMADLKLAMARFESSPDLHVAVLTGAGRVFCAGMDLGAFAAGERPGLGDPEGFAGFVQARPGKPVIAAVNGGAHAGGFELMLACDLAIVEESALFSLPEVKRGLVAAGGGAYRLPQRIPPALAMEMLLTGDPISAERAAALGLVNAIVPGAQLLPAAMALAHRIAANAPMALRETLALARQAASQGEEVLCAANAEIWARVDGSADALEGARAFKEKRAPEWTGA